MFYSKASWQLCIHHNRLDFLFLLCCEPISPTDGQKLSALKLFQIICNHVFTFACSLMPIFHWDLFDKKQTRTLRKCGSLWRARAKMFLLRYADVSLLRHRCEVSYWKKYVRHTAFSIPFYGIRYDMVSTNWNLQQAHPVTAPRSNSSSSLDRSILLQTCVKAHGVDRCLILNTCGNGTEHTRIQMLLLSVSSILLWHWGPSSCDRLWLYNKDKLCWVWRWPLSGGCC